MLAPSLLDVVQHKIIKFVGGKFRDLEVNHENNENWHPMKITRYTVCQVNTHKITAFISEIVRTLHVCFYTVRTV